ncbi:UbiA family prenyltransferase [Nocardia sp. CDC159]|uniref:UbiA family prenyltransferase n=1 Tax=Nocardia pulmonis TaxID=2951408 RepID=A0A9X2EDX9_9NOCA|nr:MULTISPECIES: UbiA family prenyltransferase [Nocardia]MCM6778684.1 UbiA family prenyltransferase [Nocardia pulmonis]MCM6791573.1 UbiA family prenyltransferase [Nocardia sp. CDC159]
MTPVASVRAYGRLANLYFLDYNLAYPMVATLLPAAVLREGRTWAAFALMIVGYFLLHCAVIAFDDITGFRDGSDAKNYRDNPSALRRAHWKPLVTGELNLAQALRFSWTCVVAGFVLLVTGLLVAPYHPLWLIVVAVVGGSVSVQYSYGLKFSHIGFQELVLLLFTLELVLIPYYALTGGVSARSVIEGALFAFWLMMVSWYSNLRDIAADREVGRINIATLTGERSYIALLGVLAVADIVAVIALVATGWLPVLFLALLLPVFAARLVQFQLGAIKRNPLLGRLLGRRLAWAGAVLMTIGNLITP